MKNVNEMGGDRKVKRIGGIKKGIMSRRSPKISILSTSSILRFELEATVSTLTTEVPERPVLHHGMH